ncbi:hypothetical protein CYMTET_43145 [Cymbomonas tetramitiformis]|uniref:Enoyl reductase (ER) domain-containing protein n=1 Tax=Cymbomonas tetramitiformis TaxID=36881 RepID=A0AAE0C4E2_9CHLO|nr:hypothetical protein CYMTET_43145 [Cymbomonas tetramitiformis]|eukprot:gene19105-22843_t
MFNARRNVFQLTSRVLTAYREVAQTRAKSTFVTRRGAALEVAPLNSIKSSSAKNVQGWTALNFAAAGLAAAASQMSPVGDCAGGEESAMKAAVYRSYGGPEEVALLAGIDKPTVAEDEVLIRVGAASINPSDVVIIGGYGKGMFEAKGSGKAGSLGSISKGSYVIGGADCVGVVAVVGEKVSNFKVGEKVWTSPDKFNNPGCWAEAVAVKAVEVAPAPNSLSVVEAASLPYVAATFFAAARAAGLSKNNAKDKKCFIHAASGSVGLLAIQVLSAWGATVVGSSSAKNKERVRSCGAEAVDYSSDFAQCGSLPPQSFDFVLNGEPIFSSEGEKFPGALQQCEARLLPLVKGGGSYVSLAHPMLHNIQNSGFLLGAMQSILFSTQALLVNKTYYGLSLGVGYHWAFASPAGEDLGELTELVEQGKVKPNVGKVFPANEIQEALKFSNSSSSIKVILEFETSVDIDKAATA